MRVLVIGGGIGGLTAAIALQRMGAEVQVFDRVSELREVGAGITLWQNAVKALRQLGAGAVVDDLMAPAQSMQIRTYRDEVLSIQRHEEFQTHFQAPTVVVHRAELHSALREAVSGENTLLLDRACVAVDQDANGVTARFADGSEARGDVLIGADGIHSAVRPALFGPDPLRYSGYTAWRGVTARPEGLETAIFEMWGPGMRFGVTHLSGDRVYWFGTRTVPEGQGDAPEGRKAELLRLYGEWPPYVRQLIEGTPDEQILRNDIHDRKPLRRWSVGRATLLGDAAHPMTPNLGQGACQAIEDAVVLAKCLSDFPTVEAALKAYEKRRVPRTSLIVKRSRLIGKTAQWQNPLLCGLRNRILKSQAAKRDNLKSLNWLLNHPL